MPGQVVAAVAIGHADAAQRGMVGGHGLQAALHRALAQHADVVPHGPRQLVAQFMDAAGRLRKGIFRALDAARDGARIRIAPAAVRGHVRGHRIAGDAAEHGGIRHAIAAEPVGAMHAATVLARRVQPRRRGRAVDVELHATHQIVRGRHHLDLAARQVEAAVLAAVDHAGEGLGDFLRTQVAHLDVHAAHGTGASGTHFRVDAPADHVARGAFAALVVVGHEALAVAIEQIAAGAAQSFLQHRARHAGVGAAQQAVGWNCTISMSRSDRP